MNDRNRELDKVFPNTINLLVDLITQGPTVDTLINIFVNLNSEAENNLNQGNRIRDVEDTKLFGRRLFMHLNNVNRILEENKEQILASPAKTNEQADKARKGIEEIKHIEEEINKEIRALDNENENLRKKNENLSKTKESLINKKNVLEKQKEEETRLQNEIRGLKKDIERLNAPDIGQIELLEKEIDGLRQQKEKLDDNKEKKTEKKNILQSNVQILYQEIERLKKEIFRLEEELKTANEKKEKLTTQITALQPDAVKKMINDLLGDAVTLLNNWASLNTDPDLIEYFQADLENAEEKLNNAYKEACQTAASLKECIKKQKDSYRKFLPEWEEIYK